MSDKSRSMPGVCLAIGLSAAASNSASADTLLSVAFPQEVTVGNVTLPPGNYVVRDMNGTAASPILFITPRTARPLLCNG